MKIPTMIMKPNCLDNFVGEHQLTPFKFSLHSCVMTRWFCRVDTALLRSLLLLFTRYQLKRFDPKYSGFITLDNDQSNILDQKMPPYSENHVRWASGIALNEWYGVSECSLGYLELALNLNLAMDPNYSCYEYWPESILESVSKHFFTAQL